MTPENQDIEVQKKLAPVPSEVQRAGRSRHTFTAGRLFAEVGNELPTSDQSRRHRRLIAMADAVATSARKTPSAVRPYSK